MLCPSSPYQSLPEPHSQLSAPLGAGEHGDKPQELLLCLPCTAWLAALPATLIVLLTSLLLFPLSLSLGELWLWWNVVVFNFFQCFASVKISTSFYPVLWSVHLRIREIKLVIFWMWPLQFRWYCLPLAARGVAAWAAGALKSGCTSQSPGGLEKTTSIWVLPLPLPHLIGWGPSRTVCQLSLGVKREHLREPWTLNPRTT